MKKTYKIEVDCPNCAAKIEEAIKKSDGINNATINFMTQKLVVDFEDDQNTSEVMQNIYKTCKKIESDFVIYM